MVKHLSMIARVAGLVAGFALSPIVAHAAPPSPEIVRQAKTMVSGYERVPTASDWSRIGSAEEVAQALMRLADDRWLVLAARATASLGHFARPEVKAFLAGRVADEKLHATLRGKAAIAIAGAFGNEAAAVIAPLFASPEAGLREDATRAFGRLAGESAERFLRARAELEPVPAVAERMRKTALAMAERRAASPARDPIPTASPPLVDPGPVRP